MPILGTIASQVPGKISSSSFESISTVTIGGTPQSTIEFTSIPSTYKHLQVRGIAKSTGSAATFAAIRLNGDNGANYSAHEISSDGLGSVGAYGASNTSNGWADPIAGTAVANLFTGFTLDVFDYQNTDKYTTIRYLGGHNTNTVNCYLFMTSAAWRDTSVVNSLSLSFSDRNFGQYSSLALYGIKG
jgi:hypothetical protein